MSMGAGTLNNVMLTTWTLNNMAYVRTVLGEIPITKVSIYVSHKQINHVDEIFLFLFISKQFEFKKIFQLYLNVFLINCYSTTIVKDLYKHIHPTNSFNPYW